MMMKKMREGGSCRRLDNGAPPSFYTLSPQKTSMTGCCLVICHRSKHVLTSVNSHRAGFNKSKSEVSVLLMELKRKEVDCGEEAANERETEIGQSQPRPNIKCGQHRWSPLSPTPPSPRPSAPWGPNINFGRC